MDFGGGIERFGMVGVVPARLEVLDVPGAAVIDLHIAPFGGERLAP